MSIKSDLARSERQTEEAKAEAAELTRKLQAKTHRYSADGKLEVWQEGPKYAQPIDGGFKPQTAGLAVSHDGALLKGGPFDGTETKVPRGAAQYERPAGSPAGFIPARYQRTKQRDADSGLTVFQYQELAVSLLQIHPPIPVYIPASGQTGLAHGWIDYGP